MYTKLPLSLALLLAACQPGHLGTTAGDYGVLFDSEPDCIEFDVSALTLEPPFTLDLFLKGGDEASYALYPLVVWPGAFALYQDEHQYLIFGPTTDTGAGTGASAPKNVLDGGYHHIAATYNTDGDVSLFFDGSPLVVSAPVVMSEQPGDALYIGCWPGQAGATFSGVIGELRLQSTQHYNTNFQPTWLQYEVEETTLALWHFNEGRGSSVLDATGGSDGVLEGGEWVEFPMPGYNPDEAEPGDTGGDDTGE